MDTRNSISRKVLRSPNLRRKKNAIPVDQRVTLEKVLGLTISSTAGLTCDPNTGAIAYPAGCVIIIFHHRRNKQSHIFNTSKKTITSVSFSGDGKYLVSGELGSRNFGSTSGAAKGDMTSGMSGHQPAVRVWDVEEKVQVAQFHGHKFGINCVAYSPNMKYIVSVGTQHDMIVNVWNWRTNNKVASNKISSKVSAVAFSSDGSYFVTVGNRHVKFWYMANSNVKSGPVHYVSASYVPTTGLLQINETVPLMGRSGILGEQKNNFFSDVACGKGSMSENTYTITQSGLLCEFNQKRLLDKWVELRAKNATGMAVGEEHVFIGCANGVIRVFDAHNLHFVASLPRPHPLGVDMSAAVSINQILPKNDATYPDSMALTYDDVNRKITCVYSDHSLYIWDVHDIKKVGKVWSTLFHSGCIWDLEIYPTEEELKTSPCLPPGSFITCSNDDTIRVWNIYQHLTEIGPYKRNIYSHEILKTYYTDPSYAFLCEWEHSGGTTDKTDGKEGKNGIRSIKVSPDGQQLASGDRTGNVRIYDLKEFTEVKTIEAHDAEVLSLEYSPFGTEPRLLATASRDRFIHIFDIEQDHGLLQTLDDHSSSITAVKFTNNDGQFRMLSCSADKSLLFRNAQLHPEFQFTLHQHLVGKTTLYDMDVDPTEKFVATACQDRNVRIYNIKSAKLKKTYKGSVSEDGVLIKLQLDPSGSYIVTSCTDKNLSLFDFYTGELVASFYGHSEIATGIKFANDLKHLISVSGDGCIFIWRLSSQLTKHMQMRMEEKGNLPKESLNLSSIPIQRSPLTPMKPIRPITLDETDSNESFPLHRVTGFLTSSPSNGHPHEVPVTGIQDMLLKNDSLEINPAGSDPSTNPMDFRISIGQLPSWAKAKSEGQQIPSSIEEPQSPTQPRGRWAQRINNQPVKSLLDANQNLNMPEIKGYRQVAYNTEIVLEEDSSQSQVDSQVDSQSFSATHHPTASAVGMVTAAVIVPGRNNSVISFDEHTDVADLDDDDDFKPCQKSHDSKSRVSGETADSNSEKDGQNLSFEMDDLDTDSDNSDVIYMPNNDDLESPENQASNFQVFASASKAVQIPKKSSDQVKVNYGTSCGIGGSPELRTTIEDGDDEDTGDEVGPLSSANTPTDPEKEIFWNTPEKVFHEDNSNNCNFEYFNVGRVIPIYVDPTHTRAFVKENFESLSFTPADHFLKRLDVLEQEMNDHLTSSTPRLSISARFLSRAQPVGVKNLAIYNSIQRQENWYDPPASPHQNNNDSNIIMNNNNSNNNNNNHHHHHPHQHFRPHLRFKPLQRRKDIMARAASETKKSMAALGWKGDSLKSPDSPHSHGQDSPAKFNLIPGKLDFSDGSPRRSRSSHEPTSPSIVKDRDIFERLSSVRERTLSGSSSGSRGIDHPGKSRTGSQTVSRNVRRSWSTQDLSKSPASDSSANHYSNSMQSPRKRSTSPQPVSNLSKHGKSRTGSQTDSRNVRRSWSTLDLSKNPANDSLSRHHISSMQSPRKRSTSPQPVSNLSKHGKHGSTRPRTSLPSTVRSRIPSPRNTSPCCLHPSPAVHAKRAKDASSYTTTAGNTFLRVSLLELRIDEDEEEVPSPTLPTSKVVKARLSLGNRKFRTERQSGGLSARVQSSSNLATCVSVPNLTCMESEEESVPSSNLRVLCDLSLSQSVPDVNKLDDQSSMSSKTTSSDPHSVPAQNCDDVLDRKPKTVVSKSNYHTMPKRRVTIASNGNGDLQNKGEHKTVKDTDLMPPPLSTAVGSLKKDTSKRLGRGRRPTPELTLDQAKNILLGKSGLLGKNYHKVTDHRKDSPSSVDTNGSDADAERSCSSLSVGHSVSKQLNYDVTERRSSTGRVNIEHFERPQSPAITVKAMTAGLRNREMKAKSFLGDLAPSPNDPPERDSPSKYTSNAFNSSYHMNVGPKSTVTHSLTSRSGIHTEPKWAKVPSSRSSSGSASSSNSWDNSNSSEGSPKLLPSVRSKVALFDSPAALKTRRRSVDKRNSLRIGSTDSSQTTAGSDTDTDMEVKRPDKSRSHSPASLITTNHSITNSTHSVALTTPMDSLPVSPKADGSQLSLPLRSVVSSAQDIPSKDEKLEACKSVIRDLKLDVEKLTALYDKVADPEQQSQELLSLLGQVIQDTQQKVAGLGPDDLSANPAPDRLCSMSTRDISTSPIRFSDLAMEIPDSSLSDVATATAVVSTDDKGINTSFSESEESPENDPKQLVDAMVRLVERKLSSNLPDEVQGMLSTFFMSFLQIVIYKSTERS